MSSFNPDPVFKQRPQFRNIHVAQILGYRMPPAALVSIMHRISGALMFVLLPFVLWLFELSLTSELSFIRLKQVAGSWWGILILLVLLWGFLHHLIAGIRFLLLDLHWGIDKAAATRGALIVYGVSLPLTLLAALKLFGAF